MLDLKNMILFELFTQYIFTCLNIVFVTKSYFNNNYQHMFEKNYLF